MKRKWISMLVSVVLVIGLAVLPAPKPAYADTCTSQGDGNWSVAGTWSCAHVPNAGDDVTVATGHTVTVDTDTASLGSLTIDSGATLTSSAGRTIYVSGNWTNSGTFIASTSTVRFNGSSGTTQTVSGSTTFYNLTLALGASVTANFGTSSITITNDLARTTGSGTMDPGTGTVISVSYTHLTLPMIYSV